MLAQITYETDTNGGVAAGLLAAYLIFGLLFLAIYLVSLWKIFTKMGQPGWTGIIPILNYVVIARLSGKEWWWGLLVIVPCVGWIFMIILLNELAKLFGHGVGMTLGLIFLPFIFLPVLAFGSSQYRGPQMQAI